MKTKLVVALATLLSVASVVAQQKYMLPIGSNVDTREMKFYLGIGDADTGSGYVNRQVTYTPQSSKTLKAFLEAIIHEMADAYSPSAGTENDTFVLAINSDSGPSVEDKFFNLKQSGNQWIVPSEVLDVKLQYGAAVVWYLKGITKITMQVTGVSGTTNFSSQDGSGYETPCGLGVTRELLAEGQALVEREYALPEFQRERGITAGSVTLWQNERYASFDLLDGHFLGVSAQPPDFLESLRAPEMPQAPVFVVNGPRISHIARVGNTTEITVSAEASGNAYLEFAETIGGSWNAVPTYPTPLSLKSGSSTFTHTTDALSCFYRLRIAESPKGQ